MQIMRVARKVWAAGLAGTLRLAVERARYEYRVLVWRAGERSFDRRFGTDTRYTPQEDTDVQAGRPQARHGYDPTRADVFRRALGQLAVDFDNYAFVDLGSGKGRILLLASEFPFKRIVGVEFNEYLHKIAQRNLEIYRSKSQRCMHIESQCIDAREYALPDDDLLLYLFNPFDAEILRSVLANLVASLELRHRSVFIVYVYPRFRAVIDASSKFEVVAHEPGHDQYTGYVIYRNRPVAENASLP